MAWAMKVGRTVILEFDAPNAQNYLTIIINLVKPGGMMVM